MKWTNFIYVILFCCFSDVVCATIPPEPILPTVPAPTSQQMNTVMPTPEMAEKPSADEEASLALAKAWVIPVGGAQSIPAAQGQVTALQQKGFSAFMVKQAQLAQVYVGPEVDQVHLNGERQQLLVQKISGVGAIVPYVLPGLSVNQNS